MTTTDEMNRLTAAARVVLRQVEGGHTPGHDAILELHRALKGVVPALVRPALDKIDAATPITCKYSCGECNLHRVEVLVPARPAEMDVTRWVKDVAAYCIYADHCCRSPKCTANTMIEMMIPITGAERIGGPSVS